MAGIPYVGPILGVAAAGAAIAAGMARVQAIRSQQFQGQAHDGIEDIPRTGTYLIEQNERVVDRRTNRDLKQAINTINSGESSGGGMNLNFAFNGDSGNEENQLGFVHMVKEAVMDAMLEDKRRRGRFSREMAAA